MIEKKYSLELNKVEFLMVKAAIERDRASIEKAIKKGIATLDDLRLTDDLNDRLQRDFFTVCRFEQSPALVRLDALDCADKWGQA